MCKTTGQPDGATDPLNTETEPPDPELRMQLDKTTQALETATMISVEAGNIDKPSQDGDPFSSATTNDVLELIRFTMEQGLIDEEVIYMLARFPAHELMEMRDQKSQHMRKIAQGSRRKKWADALADELIKKYNSFNEAWETIPVGDGGSTRYAGYEVWRDDDDNDLLRASGKDDDQIKRESFRTGYFLAAKKKQQ